MKLLDLLMLDHAGGVTERIFEDLGVVHLENTVYENDAAAYKVLCSVLHYPITDAETLRERQRIFLDFCENPHLADAILSFCDSVTPYRIMVKPGGFQTSEPNNRLRYYLAQTLPLLERFAEFPRLLSGRHFSSRTLASYRGEPSADALKGELERLASLVRAGSHGTILETYFRLAVGFGDGYKLKTARLIGIEKEEIIPIYNKKTKETVVLNEEYFLFDGMSMAKFQAEEIRKSMLLNLCSVVSTINAAVHTFFAELRVAVSFYRAAMKLKAYMERERLAFCMPTVRERRTDGIRAEGVYDLGLSLFSGATAVGSDAIYPDARTLLVTGVNSGGKTTFLRGIGIAQLLAQAGLMVPAKVYECPALSGILTHFPTEEDGMLDYGKLADELTRLRADFPLLAGGGLALFNESFATTTTREGSEIGLDVLRAVRETGSFSVFVTHLPEIIGRRAEIADGISLVTELDASGKRTYRIVPGEPQTEIFAANLW